MKPLYEIPEEISRENTVEKKLKHLASIKRSFFVYRVDAGSCNGCDIEIFSVISPWWDPERLGFKLVASPRHADILVCTGSVTRMMRYPLIRAYEAMPDPKIVVAVGACGCTGGIFHDTYATWSGIDSHIPVDMFIPGCPPHPATILDGFGVALGILQQKLKHQSYTDDSGKPPAPVKSIFKNLQVERDLNINCRELMGYIHGRKLYDRCMQILTHATKPDDISEVREGVENFIKQEEDPRYGECMRVLYNGVYLNWMDKFYGLKKAGKELYQI